MMSDFFKNVMETLTHVYPLPCRVGSINVQLVFCKLGQFIHMIPADCNDKVYISCFYYLYVAVR